MNAMPPLRADEPISVTFHLGALDWNHVIQALTKAPYYVAAPMIAQIHEQAQRSALDAAQTTDAVDGEDVWQPGSQ
jgi:hypothetical protein